MTLSPYQEISHVASRTLRRSFVHERILMMMIDDESDDSAGNSDDNGDDGDGDDDGDDDDISDYLFFLAARWRPLTWFGGKTRNWKTSNT